MYSLTSLLSTDTCKVIIETSELSFLSPSSLTHCVVVHCPALLSHDDILEAWLQRAPTKHNMSSTGSVPAGVRISILLNSTAFKIQVQTEFKYYIFCRLFGRKLIESAFS